MWKQQTGRTSFKEMLDFVKTNPDVQNLLVEKTDRLYRNLRDYISLDELSVAVHLVKEGEVISDNSKSSAKFMHGIPPTS
jgi:DNA invertase Pin-like site-specific DNA recombinase